MKALLRSGLFAITLLLTVLLAACGSAANQGTTATNTNQSKNNGNAMNNQNDGGMMNATPMTTMTPMTNATPMTNTTPIANATPTANGNMMTDITITPAMGGNMAAFIHTGKAAINGKQVNVLMTNKGFALYYYMADTMFTATCTGQCAHDWPPLLASQGMMTVSSSMPLPKQLSVHQTPNGAQIFYDSHALYTYAADMQPGVATGRAQDMQWYLVGFLL